MTQKVKLDTRGLEKLRKEIEQNSYMRADVGIFRSHNARDDGETNASVGFDMEFGVVGETEASEAQQKARGRGPMTWTGVPPRSFLRMPLEEVLPTYIAKYRSRLKKDLIEGGVEKTLKRIGQLGLIAVDMAFQTQGYGFWPSNSARTVAWKGSDRPLIDSEQLRDAQSFRVL